MAILTMEFVTVFQTGKGPNVISKYHKEPVHVTVVMDNVIWVQLLVTTTVYAIQVFPVLIVILKYALADAMVNYVALSMIKQSVTLILRQHVHLQVAQSINIAAWLVPFPLVSAMLATLDHPAIFQPPVTPNRVEQICIAECTTTPLNVTVIQATTCPDLLA